MVGKWHPIDAAIRHHEYPSLDLYDPEHDGEYGASWDGYWNDADGTDHPETGGHWVAAVWCNTHSEWHATRINPTHWRLRPTAPGKPQIVVRDRLISEGMVAWRGGDHAPFDWNGGPVLRRHGGLSMPDGPFAWQDTGADSNVVAYTSSKPAIRVALENGREFLAACYSAWVSGHPPLPVAKFLGLADEFRSALEALEPPAASAVLERDGCGFCPCAKLEKKP